MRKQYRYRGYLFCMYILLEKSAKLIAEEINVSTATISNWLRKFNIRIRAIRKEVLINRKNNYNKNDKRCDYCNEFISYIIYLHTNITQNPSIHSFCRYKCKIQWIFENNSLN